MSGVFHPGELEVQRRAGVERMARRIGGSIHASIPPLAEEFLNERHWVVLATTDGAGRPWASVVSGAPGFAQVVRGSGAGKDGDVGEDGVPASSVAALPATVRLDALPVPGDPLATNLATTEFVGLLAIDLAARRRMRINARLKVDAGGGILLHAEQVYANCPKYIQRRMGGVAPRRPAGDKPIRGGALSADQRSWIATADTFFIATVNPGEGADASHRGGLPGFVQVEAGRLVWPDYQGNTMFNTLGNIVAYPRAGLLFPDFLTGRALQLTGRASIDWDPAHAAAVPGAERMVQLVVEEVVEIQGAIPERLDLVGYSPYLPLPTDEGERAEG